MFKGHHEIYPLCNTGRKMEKVISFIELMIHLSDSLEVW